MRRWVWNITAGSSLLLFLATTGILIRSYFAYHEFTWITLHRLNETDFYQRRVILQIGKDGIGLSKSTREIYDPVGRVQERKYFSHDVYQPFNARPFWGIPKISFLGFQLSDYEKNQLWTDAYEIIVPLWSVCLGTILLPCLRGWQIYKKSTLMSGDCSKCGYDLRATPKRCPECGTVVKKSVMARLEKPSL
jgi:hypothetical protein